MLLNNLNFLFLQSGSSCVSNCDGCVRKYGKNNKNFEKLYNNILQIKNNNIFNNNLLIYNVDYFGFKDNEIGKILSFGDFFKDIYFHTNFRNIGKKVDGGVKFIYQRDFTKDEIKFLIQFLSLKIFQENNIKFIFWCENYDLLKKFLGIIEYFKFSISNYNYNGNSISFNINNWFFLFNLKDGERRNLEKCFFKKFINRNHVSEVNFTNNFYISCLEILLNGDIRCHEPPCGFGDILISNIYRNNTLIQEDFLNFDNHITGFLNNFSGLNQNNICDKCIKNKYRY